MISENRRASILIVVGALLAAVSLAAVASGPAPIAPVQVIQLVLSRLSDKFDGMLTQDILAWYPTILWQIRLPRVLIAMMVGAALALCGAVLQGLSRNPLAEPSVLGMSSGASLGAVIAIYFGLAAISIWTLPLFAFLGSAATLFVVFTIATQGGQTPVAGLLLSGVAISAFNVAMTSLVLALALQNWEVAKTIVYWTMGGLEGRTWDHVLLLLPVFAITYWIIRAYQRDLDVLLMGEIHAASVGIDVPKTRFHLLVVTALLVGCSVAVSGGIGFVGLVVPHVVRLLAGPHHRHLLPLCALGGALILVLADLLLRNFFQDNNIPLGVFTAVMGAPFFVFLLLKQRKLMKV